MKIYGIKKGFQTKKQAFKVPGTHVKVPGRYYVGFYGRRIKRKRWFTLKVVRLAASDEYDELAIRFLNKLWLSFKL